MKAVNGSLGGIYQQLTGGQGDACLTYTEDALLLFAEGVHFHVRHALRIAVIKVYMQQMQCACLTYTKNGRIVICNKCKFIACHAYTEDALLLLVEGVRFHVRHALHWAYAFLCYIEGAICMHQAFMGITIYHMILGLFCLDAQNL